ncbi:MAG: S4 domain-containing protein, partial [Sphingomonadales bacterium]
MTGVHHTTITTRDEGMRLDRWFLKAFTGLSFGQLSKLLRTGQIRVNGKRIKGGERLHAGDDIRIPPMKLNQPPQAKTGQARLSKDDVAFA